MKGIDERGFTETLFLRRFLAKIIVGLGMLLSPLTSMGGCAAGVLEKFGWAWNALLAFYDPIWQHFVPKNAHYG